MHDEEFKVEVLPIGFQAVQSHIESKGEVDGQYLFNMRTYTMRKIEELTGNMIFCYVAKTDPMPNLPPDVASIQDSDIEPFETLIDNASESRANHENVDVFLISNGGYPEAAERIVRLLRENFKQVRFILPSNAFSAATMMAFACDSILMTDGASLGPIDPQIGGIPARTILRGMDELEKKIKEEGPATLGAYIHLIRNYDLHLLEICKSAEELSRELATSWLSEYMLKCDPNDEKVAGIVRYFADFDIHKSHGRSVGRKQAIEIGVRIESIERGQPLHRLVRSLHSQYLFMLSNTPFYKLFENAYSVGYGRQAIVHQISMPTPPLSTEGN